jgi:hypothetical protein
VFRWRADRAGFAGTGIALATLWLLKYIETTIAIGRRGIVAVTFPDSRQHERELLALLAARGLAIRSRRVELYQMVEYVSNVMGGTMEPIQTGRPS